MLLEGKNSVIYGGGGSVGGAVARALAREGARVVLGGRTPSTLEAVAEEIRAAGGQAEIAQVDALDEDGVERLVAGIVERVGGIDVSFNATRPGNVVHGVPLLEMAYGDVAAPVVDMIRSEFVTARAAARHMAARGSGVIMSIVATTSRHKIPNIGGTGVMFDAMESLARQWATELGPRGVRVVWLRSTGLPEAFPPDTGELSPDYGTGGMTRERHIEWMQERTRLGRLTSLAELGAMAAFMASDLASATTGTAADVTSGSL